MSELFERLFREVHGFVDAEEFKAELKAAKEEFWKKTGKPLPGEPIEELRLVSFIEWFIFDRFLTEFKRTPLEEFMRRRADELSPEEIEILRGFSANVHAVFLVLKRDGRTVDLKDLYTGRKFRGVQRAPISLGKGDMAELRLIPAGGEFFSADALCFHPFSAKKRIERILKEAGKKGEPPDDVLERLMAMNTRSEHSPKTAKVNAYGP